MDIHPRTTAEIALEYMKKSQLQVASASLATLRAARLRFAGNAHADDVLTWVEDALLESYRSIDCEPRSLSAGLMGLR